MRISAKLTILSGVLLALSSGAALAQSSQSAQQIIDALKPTGTLSDTTRGIKPLPPGPPGGSTMAPSMQATPASSSMANAAPPAAAPSTNLDVEFQSGSADLTPQAVAALDQLGTALSSSQLAGYNFKIVGHTDTTGDPATNQSLSEQRAQAVKSYLESKFSVADTRLQAQGVGEADLLVPTPPQTPEEQNRRVEVINLGQ